MAAEGGVNDSTGSPPKISFCNWLKERKKLLGYELHHFFLVKYQKSKRIPRALRIDLRPTWFSADKGFCAEFEGILKKCSLELMDLSMKQLVKEIRRCKEEIMRQEDSLEDIFTPEEWGALKEKSERQLQILRLEIEARKKRTFMQDEEDYRKGIVYKWTEETMCLENSFQQLDQRRPRLETIKEETLSEIELMEKDETTLTHKKPIQKKRNRRGGKGHKGKEMASSVKDSALSTQRVSWFPSRKKNWKAGCIDLDGGDYGKMLRECRYRLSSDNERRQTSVFSVTCESVFKNRKEASCPVFFVNGFKGFLFMSDKCVNFHRGLYI